MVSRLRTSSSSGGDATTIGAESQIKGRIEGQEDVVVLGRVEGSIVVTEKVTIDAAASVAAEIDAREVEIAGAVAGDVSARDSVILHASAKLVGNISAPRLVIADGASFKGQIDMGDAPRSRRPAAPARATAARGQRASARGAGSRRDDREITVVVKHAELRKGELPAAGDRSKSRASAAAPKKKPPKKPVRARVPTRGRRAAKRR